MQGHGTRLEVVEGDARNVLCDAVEKHHASVLVVGSHGYGAIKRYGLCLSPQHTRETWILQKYDGIH